MKKVNVLFCKYIGGRDGHEEYRVVEMNEDNINSSFDWNNPHGTPLLMFEGDYKMISDKDTFENKNMVSLG